MQTGLRDFAASRYGRSSFLVLCFAVVLTAVFIQCGLVYADVNPEYTAALEQLGKISEEYDALTIEQDHTYTELETVRAKITENESEISEVEGEIAERQNELAIKQAALSSIISTDYKTGGAPFLSLLLSATSFEDAVAKVRYYEAVYESETEQISEINAIRGDLEENRYQLNQLKQSLLEQEASVEKLYEQQRAQTDEMFAQQMAATELVNSLPKEVQESLGSDGEELLTEANSVQPVQDSNASPAQSAASDNSSTEEITTQEEVAESTAVPSSPSGDGSLQALLDSAYATGATRRDWGCSGWVYVVFKGAGISNFSGSAAQFYNAWCYSSDRSELEPGMVIAVPNTGGSPAGRMYGHVGIYVGNNTVRHYTGGVVQEISVDGWIKKYGKVVSPRWGWNGGAVLS